MCLVKFCTTEQHFMKMIKIVPEVLNKILQARGFAHPNVHRKYSRTYIYHGAFYSFFLVYTSQFATIQPSILLASTVLNKTFHYLFNYWTCYPCTGWFITEKNILYLWILLNWLNQFWSYILIWFFWDSFDSFHSSTQWRWGSTVMYSKHIITLNYYWLYLRVHKYYIISNIKYDPSSELVT